MAPDSFHGFLLLRVVCVNNDHSPGTLTVGKEYETYEDDESPGLALMTKLGYCIILEDDQGKRNTFQLSRFESA